MPTYEYACTACANEWEEEQSIKDAALTECPKCHKPTAKRQISRGAGFILKGGGWYSDLYSSSSTKKAEGSSASSDTSSSTTAGSASSGSAVSTAAAATGASTPAASTSTSTSTSGGSSGEK